MRRRTILSIVLLLLGSTAIGTHALPDLTISAFDLRPGNPVAGQQVEINVVVSNLGASATSDPFSVHVRVDGEEIAVRPFVDPLSSGGSVRMSLEWEAVVGPHTLVVEVDPAVERIEESDETNNVKSILIAVQLSPESAAILSPLKVVVAPFEDLTFSGFLNLGVGVADKVSDRLAGSGVRVLQRTELEAIMQERGLNPAQMEDVAQAGRLLGADALVTGAVTGVHVVESSLQLGFLSLSGADVDVQLSAKLIDVDSAEVLSVVPGEGHDEGATGFSVNLGGLLSSVSDDEEDICGGGLQTARSWYNAGESVPFAYHNAGAPRWFSIEVVTAVGAFVEWLGWQYVGSGSCGIWYWDQLNASGMQMSTGVYAAKVWDGTTYVAEVGFQIRPGISLTSPPVIELTVGTAAFEDTVVGGALNHAADDLTAGLLEALQAAAPALTALRDDATFAATPLSSAEGQVAAVLPDGRVAINLGASSGVVAGDIFQVVEVANLVVDPQSLEILSYDTLSVRGTLVISEVRERVSFGIQQSSFEPAVGDVVREMVP